MKHILVLALLLISCWGSADERIHVYDVQITVAEDATLTVTETIEVTASGVRIRRGIYRDFPTRYQDKLGNHYKVGFDILSIKRNGNPEDYHLAKISRGTRIYIGHKNRFLTPGRHVYELQYKTNRQLGFFDQYDQLYWNAVGTYWEFPIEQVNVAVTLPAGIAAGDIHTEHYSGRYGEQGQVASSRVGANSVARFSTRKALRPREGLTVVVDWPKGYVQEPDLLQKLQYLLKDNRGILAALMGLGLILAYYLWIWNRVGRDPEAGTIIPLYAPPKNLSPAACRYIQRMGFDKRALTAAIINLGVKGYVRIEDDDGDFRLIKTKNKAGQELSAGEKEIFQKFFIAGRTSLNLINKNHRTIGGAKDKLHQALAREYKHKLFKTNSQYLLPAIGLKVLLFLLLVALGAPVYIKVLFTVLNVVLLIVFLLLFKAPTGLGRLVMDKIEGFKLYLETAEGQRLNRMRSPQMTPEVFETFLPYAYALGVENDWSDQFKRVLAAAAEQGREMSYQAPWYHGNDYTGINVVERLSSDLHSGLGSAVSSAASPPGSSSGSGGGGFSGGGGGGGGGGGW